MTGKIDKKDLEEPDKLQLLFLRIRAFAETNKTQIYIGGVTLILIVALVSGWYIYKLNYETSASKIYARVFESTMRAGSPKGDDTAIKGYKDLVAEYPRSRAAVTAYLKLGNLYYSRHEVDTAMTYFQDFLNNTPPDSDLISLAQNSLGYCYEVKKDYAKALEFYENAAKINTTSSFESLNYTGMARVYEARTEYQKAVEYYKKALEKTSDALMTLYLKRKISLLG